MHFTIFLSAFVRVMCKLHIYSHCSRKHGAGPTVNRAVSSVASIEFLYSKISLQDLQHDTYPWLSDDLMSLQNEALWTKTQ